MYIYLNCHILSDVPSTTDPLLMLFPNHHSFFFMYFNWAPCKVVHWAKWSTSIIQYNTIQYNTIQYNTIQYNTIQYNTIQYNTIQYNTIQYNTIQYNTIQYNTIQYCSSRISTSPTPSDYYAYTSELTTSEIDLASYII